MCEFAENFGGRAAIQQRKVNFSRISTSEPSRTLRLVYCVGYSFQPEKVSGRSKNEPNRATE